MKIRLLAAAIAMTTPLKIAAINTDGLDLYFNKIGPYNKYQNPCPYFDYEVISRTTNGGNYTITIMFGDDKVDNRRTIQNETGNLDYCKKKTFSIQVPTNLCLGDGGMKITFKAKNNNTNKNVANFNFVIYPKTPTTINPLRLDEGKFNSDNLFATKSGKFTVLRGEEYDFGGFVDYFLTDTYYSLPLEQYMFKRQCYDNPFVYKEANLYINGGENYFPGLSFINGRTKIPLLLSINKSKVSISFAKTMYVDPKLLFISLSPKDGYVATNYFFFPVNHNKDLEGLTFTFELLEMGISGLNAIWDTSYLAINGLLGSCQNSEYCVDGEIEK